MDFAICLDQFSTNFNVSSLSPNGFSIYTDLDYTNPIASGIPYQDLFAPPIGNCPLIVNVPQGATQILVIDACTTLPTNVAPIFNAGSSANSLITQCCYAVIPVPAQPISWCNTSGLEFDIFSSSYIGQIVAGNLTSTLGTVTDYTIGWYLDGDYSSPVFVSGYGNSFIPYNNLHPLTGSASVPVLAGNWEGIIHDIAINGTTYSSVSGSANGTPIPFESCFDTVVVAPLECDNGSVSPAVSKYSHHINYNSQAVGTTSSPVSFTYALSDTTNYFAYLFQGLNVWDELEIKFKSGDPQSTGDPTLYSQPIYLEKIKIGNDVTGVSNYSNPNTTPYLPTYVSSNTSFTFNNVWPKIWQSNGNFQRVLSFATISQSSNPLLPDLLEITVTPNPTNNNTIFRAGFECLETFDCTDCYLDDYPNNLPKIWKFRLEKQYGCDKQRLQIHLTGACSNAGSDFMGSGFTLDALNDPNLNLVGSIGTPTSLGYVAAPNNWVNLTPAVSCQSFPQFANINCAPPSTGQITLNKTFQQIQLTFNLESDYLHYKNDLINRYNALSYNPSLNAFSPDPAICSGDTSVNYYKYFKLYIPVQGANANCGDNTTQYLYFFHFNDYFNVVYNESPSTNTWSITIPQTPITNCYPQNLGCDSCYSSIQSFVNGYNNSVNNISTFTFTTNVGAKYIQPFASQRVQRNSSVPPSGSYCFNPPGLNQYVWWYPTHTIPFVSSSNGWVNLTSLSSSLPCDTTPYSNLTSNPPYQAGILAGIGNFTVRFPNLTGSFNYSLSTNDFEVYARDGFPPAGTIHYSSNSFPAPCPDPATAKIYSYIGGVATVYTSSHFWQGNNPTLIIDP
jgi:hypothetical protein